MSDFFHLKCFKNCIGFGNQNTKNPKNIKQYLCTFSCKMTFSFLKNIYYQFQKDLFRNPRSRISSFMPFLKIGMHFPLQNTIKEKTPLNQHTFTFKTTSLVLKNIKPFKKFIFWNSFLSLSVPLKEVSSFNVSLEHFWFCICACTGKLYFQQSCHLCEFKRGRARGRFIWC